MTVNRRPLEPRDRRPPTTRVNHRIRVPEVRLIAADGSLVGVVPTYEALRMAEEAALDLVEINAKSDPPLCKILDFGKMKYEDKKKAAEARRKQTVIEVKELKLRPKTDDHDLHVKINHARRFLEEGNKVKFTVRFRGREIAHPEQANQLLEQVVKDLDEIAIVEITPKLDGKMMLLQIAPKPQVFQKLSQQRIQQEKQQRMQSSQGSLNGSSHSSEDDSPDDEDVESQDN